VLDALLPRRCVVCRRPGTQLCGRCREELPRLAPPLCERCGRRTEWPVERCRECYGRRLAFASARAAVEYDERVRRLVGAWKERGLRLLAAHAAELVTEVVPRPVAAALVAVPPARDRTLRRGHHPPARLAQELARRWELPVEPLLARTREIGSQRGLDRAARRRNVRGAFRGHEPRVASLCLVDDVYTTGATVSSAASALRAAGARRVEVVTFARAVR
jgi:ComF family protein